MLLFFILLVSHTVLARYSPSDPNLNNDIINVNVDSIVDIIVNIQTSGSGGKEDAQTAERDFELFIKKYNKTYHDEAEKDHRFEIFKENLFEIDMLNEKYSDTRFGINQFADLTKEEFLKMYTGFRPDLAKLGDSCTTGPSILEYGAAPDAYDWRDHITMNVKDQQRCGSCWAFSATGNIEAQYFMKTQQLVSLSEQQLVDCDSTSSGCQGGWPSAAIEYLMQAGGQESEDSYPYAAQQQSCQFSGQVQVKVTGCNNFPMADENQLKETLYQNGPLSVVVDAESLQKYTGGVLTNCENGQLNHAIMLVGYGNDAASGKDFWVIKNSWAESWGEGGYARIERGVNACGIVNDFIVSSVVA